MCEKNCVNPQETYQALVQKYFTGSLKPPFNKEARDAAGFEENYYLPLVTA
jgi:uncharacterized ferritin-like protein (DUF455 family)